MKQALKRSNITDLCSEVPVISALNPYRAIEDVSQRLASYESATKSPALQEDLAMWHKAQGQLVQIITDYHSLDVKSDVVPVIHVVHAQKEFGVKQKARGIQAYEKKERVVVNDRNVAEKSMDELLAKVIEVENRLPEKFLSPIAQAL
uniref:Uncharacterized protein n=1 Tax=Peronospora matthiolae TaxID=2874970 RepID=A0AAV1TK99_9STRA